MSIDKFSTAGSLNAYIHTRVHTFLVDELVVHLVIQLLPCGNLLIHLLVVRNKDKHGEQHDGETERRDAQARAEADGVAGGLGGDEDVAADKVCAVANAQEDGGAKGLRGTPAQVGRQHANVERHADKGAEANEELRKVTDAGRVDLLQVENPANGADQDGG